MGGGTSEGAPAFHLPLRRSHVSITTKLRRLAPLIVLALGTTGCPDPLAGKIPPPGQVRKSPHADSRYIKIRTLLGEDPDSAVRARELYPLLLPLCTSQEERQAFVKVAKWSVESGDGQNYRLVQLAQDCLEHVSTACMRNHPEGAFALLDLAQETLPGLRRVPVLQARLLAASGKFEQAETAARRAMAAGSIHAIALTANIQARRARGAEPGLRTDIFNAAIETVSATPTNKWAPIDLAAVLSTKARLLTERALWETEEQAQRTRLEAASLHQRLAGAPFIAVTRRRAQDILCFDAMQVGKDRYNACRRLAEMGDLGGARAIGLTTMTPQHFEMPRLAKLQALKEDLEKLPLGQVVVLVIRGDEMELLEWIRPATTLIRHINKRKPRWVVVDRTDSPRATNLIQRLLDMSQVQPDLRIDAKGTFYMSCISAILAGRRTPKSCPLPPEVQTKLEGLGPYALSLLLGRDLDAELDDLRLYELRTVLVSFRQSRQEKAIHAWTKSLSDVGIITTPKGFGALEH